VSSGFSVGGGKGATGAFQMAIVGGTVSAIGGGKFANRAMGSAFQYMFNDWASFKKSISGLGTKLTDGTITGDIAEAFEKGEVGALGAIEKAPIYAKLPLMHASGVVGAGAYSGGVLVTGAVLSHPVEVVEGSLDFIGSYLPTGSTSASWSGLAGASSGVVYGYEKQ